MTMTSDPEHSSTTSESRTGWTTGVDIPMTLIATGIVLAFLIAGTVYPNLIAEKGEAIYVFFADWFGWIWVLGTAFFVAFIVFLAVSDAGKIKLGDPHDQPEYSAFSWISMMFALGVGIGLIFFGAAEPLMLFAAPPPGGPPPRTPEAALVAMQYSLFHWGFHVWAFFGVAGLAFAYTTHRKQRPALITSTLEPLIGRYAHGLCGRGINTWIIITTLVGNAVTLGLGVLQVRAGLGYVGGIEPSKGLLVLIVGTLTIGFLLSATAGIDKGIKRLADFNSLLAIALLIFILVLGPLNFIFDFTTQAVGAYLDRFIPMSFQTGAFADGTWMRKQTLFYWAWGISWAPYVGSFLAKISRGRTIREYTLGVLVAPTVATIFWFGVIGSSALDLQLGGAELASVATEDAQKSFFAVLEYFPFSMVTGSAVIFLAAVFFISGADAGAIVLGTFSSWGDPEPKKWITLLWGTQIGLVALVLLMLDGLNACMWGAIVAAAPFVLVLIAMCIALVIDLRRDGFLGGRPGEAPSPTELE